MILLDYPLEKQYTVAETNDRPTIEIPFQIRLVERQCHSATPRVQAQRDRGDRGLSSPRLRVAACHHLCFTDSHNLPSGVVTSMLLPRFATCPDQLLQIRTRARLWCDAASAGDECDEEMDYREAFGL